MILPKSDQINPVINELERNIDAIKRFIRMDRGYVLRKARLKARLSQTEVAVGCRINRVNLSGIENGRKNVGPKMMIKILEFIENNTKVFRTDTE